MSAKNGSIKLVAGNSNPVLAQGIAKELGIELTKAVVRRFADMAFLFQDQNQGTRTTTLARAKIARAAATVLFHPDCNRRLRSCTESADPSSLLEEGARGLGLLHPYRRWGFSPRPENIGRPEWTTCVKI